MRRLAVLALVLSTIPIPALAIGPEDPGGSFVDDDDSLHEGSIEAIAVEGVTRGCDPQTNLMFCPWAAVTRGQMASFLRRALDLPPATRDYFSDDRRSWQEDINAVAEAGITRGCNPPENTAYCPDWYVTRGQMAAFLGRAFGYSDEGTGDHFVDDDDTVFEEDIDRLATAGVTKGCNPPANDRFCPQEPVSREEMASFLARAMGLSVFDPPPPETGVLLSAISGDTFEVRYRGTTETVRLIGIDAPDVGEPCFEASRSALESPMEITVRLDRDVSDRDDEGRLLRYAFHTFVDSQTFLNAAMVGGGWAAADDNPPDSQFADLLEDAQETAQRLGMGIWDPSTCD